MITHSILSIYCPVLNSVAGQTYQACEKIYKVATSTLGTLVISGIAHGYVLAKYPHPHGSITFFAATLTSALIVAVAKKTWKLVQEKRAQDLANLSLVHLSNLAFPSFYIHEQFGHGIAARLLLKQPDVKIMIKSFESGKSSYAISYGLTKVGQYFGKRYSLLIIASAGLWASLAFATSELAMAHFLKEKYPTIAKCLTYYAISQLIFEVSYGLTSFVGSQFQTLDNDFVRLWRIANIHPIIPIALFILIPTIQSVALNAFFKPPNRDQPLNT
jgi:hypothetical protein